MRELPAVGRLLADALEDDGFLNLLGILVAKSPAASSLSNLAIIAVHIQIHKRRHLEAERQCHLRQV